MKEGIHPKYIDATITCACGAVYKTRTTVGDMMVEICSNCHPFFTGQQKFVDTQGQVEKFTKTLATAQVRKQERAKILESRAAKVQKIQTEKPTLKDLLLQARKKRAS